MDIKKQIIDRILIVILSITHCSPNRKSPETLPEDEYDSTLYWEGWLAGFFCWVQQIVIFFNHFCNLKH